MAPNDMEAPRAFERLSRQQLEIYARELQEHFQGELRLRKELETLNQQMAQQLQETAALNRLFQQHLGERFEVVEAYRQVLKELLELARRTATLARRAEAQLPPDLLPPDLQDACGPGSENGGSSQVE